MLSMNIDLELQTISRTRTMSRESMYGSLCSYLWSWKKNNNENRIINFVDRIHKSIIPYYQNIQTHFEENNFSIENYDYLLEVSYYIGVTWWYFISILLSIYTQLLCLANIPYDCPKLNPIIIYDTLSELLSKIASVYFLARMNKTQVLLSWYFYFVIILTTTIFGLLGNIFPALVLSSKNTIYDEKTQILFYLCLSIILLIGIYHVIFGFKIHWKYGITYLISLIFIIIYYTIYIWLFNDVAIIRFHHNFLFWILAWFCRYDNPISKISLAICCGIFIQGTAIYGSDQRLYYLKNDYNFSNYTLNGTIM